MVHPVMHVIKSKKYFGLPYLGYKYKNCQHSQCGLLDTACERLKKWQKCSVGYSLF